MRQTSSRRAVTPPLSNGTKHYDTPTRTSVLRANDFVDSLSPTTRRRRNITKKKLYRKLQVPERSARHIVRTRKARQFSHTIGITENRGRKKKLTEQDVHYVEQTLLRHPIETRRMNWDGLSKFCNLNVSGITLRRAMGKLDYRRCMSCQRNWVSERVAALRVKYAKTMLKRYPRPEDWYNVRFSDETHLGFGPHGRYYITRKPSEKNCAFCVQTTKQPREKDEKRLHCWAAVGFGFKSDLYFYDNGTSNGKMDIDTYMSILAEATAEWPRGVVLEEDRDSAHGTGVAYPLRAWKRESGLKFFFNCAASPDLSPIENCWLAPKEQLKARSHWDDITVKDLTVQGWEKLSQQTIDSWIFSMPERLQAVIDGNGQMTTF